MLLGVFVADMLCAQAVERHWHEGPLSWFEFKEEVSARKSESLAYYLGYKQDREKRGDSVFVRLKAYAYLDKEQAVVRPIDKVSPYLMYHQVIFDMTEYYRRTLQKHLDRAENIFVARAIFDELYEDFQSDAHNLIQQSRNGDDYEEVLHWRKLVTDTLDNTPTLRSPAFYKRNFGIGMYGGLGTSIQTGRLSKQFTTPVLVSFGFDFGFRNVMLYLNGSIGGNRSVSNDLSGQDRFVRGSAGVAIIDLSLGYAIIDVNKWKIVPFVGAGVTEYSPNSEAVQNEYDPLTSYNVVLGVVADYKVRKRVKLTPVYGKEVTDSSIRLRVFATPVDMGDDLIGMTINLGVAYCGFARFIGVK